MDKRYVSIVAIAAIGLLTVVNSLVLVRANVSAARLSATSIPQRISYQGRLTDAGDNPLHGTYTMCFRLYDVPAGGVPCWTECQDVTVEYGVFSVLIGDITPIPQGCFSGPDLYLGVKVGSDGEMTPRRRVVSVGYAYRAEESSAADYASSAGNADYASSAGNADTVDDEHADDFADASHTHDASEITSGIIAPERILDPGIPRMKTGTYTGNGQAIQAITGVGFRPKLVMIWPQVTSQASCWATDQEEGGHAHVNGMLMYQGAMETIM